MLMPKKVKYRKVQRGTRKGRSKGARELAFGTFGLQAIDPVWLTARQIEAMRVTLSRHLKKVGKLFLRVFPDKPVTKKPAETRMGGGKGDVYEFVAPVKSGRMLFEMGGITDEQAKEALNMASAKLPIKSRFVSKKLMYL